MQLTHSKLNSTPKHNKDYDTTSNTSMGFIQHKTMQPCYRMDQGARDTCNHWVIRSDSMIEVYQEKSHGWSIPTPIPDQSAKLDLKAFINDMNILLANPQDWVELNFVRGFNMTSTDGIDSSVHRRRIQHKKLLLVRFSTAIQDKRNPSLQPKQNMIHHSSLQIKTVPWKT